MFNSNHYVPILKWKRAEQGALKALSENSKAHITPLIQFVMPKSKPDEQLEDVILKFVKQVPEMSTNIIGVWGKNPIFIDVSLLYTDQLKASSLEMLLQEGRTNGGFFIPVIHTRENSEIKRIACAFAKESKNGLCLRVIISDLSELDVLNREISDFLQSFDLEAKNIDLMVDIKETGKNRDKYSEFLTLSQNISNLSEWRTFTFAAGSFPENLSECKLDEENLIERVEWNGWKKHVSDQRLRRKPTFADYTIQHPIYKETVQFFHPTSSIKYTLENEWLVMKGRKQKFELYLASAAVLLKDKRFNGEDFSEGDKYIAEKARHFEEYIKDPKIKGTGSTETWLKAGINHHLALTADQISNLS